MIAFIQVKNFNSIIRIQENQRAEWYQVRVEKVFQVVCSQDYHFIILLLRYFLKKTFQRRFLLDIAFIRW